MVRAQAVPSTAGGPTWARSSSLAQARWNEKNTGTLQISGAPSGRRRSSPLGCLAEDVVGHVLDVVRAQLLAEGRHGVLAVGHLGLDGLHVVAAREVLLERLLLQLLLRRHGVVAAGVAGGAVALADALPVLQVRGQGRP